MAHAPHDPPASPPLDAPPAAQQARAVRERVVDEGLHLAHAAFSDIQRVAKPVLRHRLIRSFEGEADGITTDQVAAALVESVPTRPEAVEKAMSK